MPSDTRELPDEEQLVDEMLSQGVKAARVFPHPDQHNFPMKPWVSEKLLRALEDKRIPLFVDQEQIDWETMHELCQRHTRLPLVLTGVGYRVNRILYPLWQKLDNLYVDLSNYCGHGAIEDVTERFGAQRLLFGTRLPYFTPGAAVAMLSYANVPESDKRLIAGDNLRNLLSRAGNG
jgi:predicted TIM-barrel fold metal-dependent hydrolase